jgi:hypothetical protein
MWNTAKKAAGMSNSSKKIFNMKNLKTPEELGISKTQFKNLAKLITFVRTKVEPPKFDIGSFLKNPADEDDGAGHFDLVEPVYECGTTACFCGYGPLAKITPEEGELWKDYAERSFGAKHEIFDFLFSGEHLNCRDAACLRGAYLLINGLPILDEDVSYDTVEVPESFIPDWEAIEKAAK